MKKLTKEDIERLPVETKNDVYETLKSYNEANIIFEDGKYKVTTWTGVYSTYSKDFKFVGVITKDVLYSIEEQIINYMESFHEYHPLYKGKRNYEMLRSIEGNWNVKFKLKDGELCMI